MSKFLYLQDFHLSGKTPENRKDNYLQSMLLKLDEILDIAKTEKVDKIIDGGDFLESPLIANTIIDSILDKIEVKKIPFYMLFGNHCEIGHNIENSKGTSLAHMIRRSKYVNYLETIEDNTIFVKGIEYKHNIELQLKEEGLFHNKKDKLTIVIVHALITEKPLPYSAMHICYKNIKSNFDYILAAHNHHPFNFEIDNTKILNIGCIGRRKIDEQNIKPSVLLINTATKKLEIIKLKSPVKSEIVFDLEKLEKMKKFESNIDSFINSLDNIKLQSLDVRGKIEEIAKKINEDREVVDKTINRILRFENEI